MTAANTDPHETVAAPPPPDVEAKGIPTSQRFLYGVGGFADCMMYNGLNGLVDPIYNMAMGIDARIIGMARSIPRFADIIIDPLIGHLSDNTRSRWGRRSRGCWPAFC